MNFVFFIETNSKNNNMFYLACKKCGHQVSGLLKRETKILEGDDTSSYVLKEESLFLSLQHLPYFGFHQRYSALSYGCCGPEAEGALNLVCPSCRVPIAREVSDCGLIDTFIRVQRDLIDVSAVTPEFADKLYEAEKTLPVGSSYMNDLLTLMKWNPKELKRQLKRFAKRPVCE